MPASDPEFKGEIGRRISFTTPASVMRRDLHYFIRGNIDLALSHLD
jgi:hypothetical protein